MATRRTMAFVWENIGPTYADRLDALGIALEGVLVVAIEYSRRSATYDWDAADGTHFALHTLFAPGERQSNLRFAWRLIRACWRLGRSDVFFGHYDQWPLLIAAWAVRLRGGRAYATIDSKFDDYLRRWWFEALKVAFLSPYRGILVASLRSFDYARFRGFRADRIAFGMDALSIERIAALAQSPPAPDGAPFAERDFIVVARLVPKKNIAMAIDAYGLWRGQSGAPRDLHICGSGPLKQELRDQVARAGLTDHVHFHGFVQSDEVARLLARSLCLILPSVEEQFGLVVIEAQAMGLPALVSRNAGACDILIDQGINGYTLDPRNPASCAALMLQLSEDEATWRRFATAARDGRDRGDCPIFIAGVKQLTGS